MDQLLASLQQWYSDQCDGDWEHGGGIRIETLDNPGWLVKWHSLTVNGSPFEGFGGPSSLAFLLEASLTWAQNHS